MSGILFLSLHVVIYTPCILANAAAHVKLELTLRMYGTQCARAIYHAILIYSKHNHYHESTSIVCSLLFSSAAAIHLDGTVLESGRNGTDVVLLSVAYIQQAVIFPEDNGLLRRIAYVETRDGLDGHPKSSPSGSEDGRDRSGIWAVRRDSFTNIQTSSDSDIIQKRDQIKLAFGVDWEAVQWSELNNPFYSALAARLVLFTAPQNIPHDRETLAQFWRDHYNVHGSVEDFMSAVKYLEGKNGLLSL